MKARENRLIEGQMTLKREQEWDQGQKDKQE